MIFDSIESEDENETDFHGKKSFSPFTSRPMIKCIVLDMQFLRHVEIYIQYFAAKYDHSQESMEKIGKQTRAIFSDTLVHSGLARVSICQLAFRIWDVSAALISSEDTFFENGYVEMAVLQSLHYFPKAGHVPNCLAYIM